MVFRRAKQEEMTEIMDMQFSIFHDEQGIPADDIRAFAEKNPNCWCAEQDGELCGAVAAWNENGELHWGRFVVSKEMRGKHIGTKLAECSFDDIFSGYTETIYMEARDITVNIVCKMGGEVIGEPVQFFIGNVTPVILRKSDYIEKRCIRVQSPVFSNIGID